MEAKMTEGGEDGIRDQEDIRYGDAEDDHVNIEEVDEMKFKLHPTRTTFWTTVQEN